LQTIEIHIKMKTKAILILAAVFSMIFNSCEKFGSGIIPSGNITTETRDVTGFDEIDVSTAFNVYVTFSETEESVEIEANENLHRIIEVYEQGGSLVIKLQNGTNVRGHNVKLNAYITTSDLSGASNLRYKGDGVIKNSDLSGASSVSKVD